MDNLFILYGRKHSRSSDKVYEPNLTNDIWYFKHYFTALRVLCKLRQAVTAQPFSPADWERIRTSKPIKTQNGCKFMGTWIWTAEMNFYEYVIIKCPLLDSVEQFKNLAK